MPLRLTRPHSPNAPISRREVSMSDYLPYHYHWDHETIVTKKGELLQVIKLDGYSFETADDEDVNMKKTVRNSLYKNVGSGNFALWFHIIRRRQSAYPQGNMPPGFATELNERWKKRHHSKDLYVNELYITVVYKADTKGAAKISHWITQLEQKADKVREEEAVKEARKELSEACYRITAALKDYGARVLTVRETEFGSFSEPLEFLSRILNGGASHPMRVPLGDVSQYLPTSRLYFGERAIEIRSATRRKFASLISIKEYAPVTAAGILDAFLQLPFELIISQSYAYTNRQTAIEKMQIQQRRMMQAEDVAVTQVAEISEALDMAMSGHVAFGTHHLTVMCLEDTLDDLDDATSAAMAELLNIGINAVREKMVMEPCFWAQFPANFPYIARKADINTMNLAGFASLHNYPAGRIRDNHWGDAVSVFDTTSGTPYFFNFHLRDVGHTMIIGPTGSGKTVLMNFLSAQAQKFKCRMFVFDKDRGCEIFVRALGGHYDVIDPGARTSFNPLQLPDTLENRSFLNDWLRALVSANGEALTAEEIARIEEAVNGNYKLKQEDRLLRNIAPFFGLEVPGSIGSRLRMWHSNGQYAPLFDNLDDRLDLRSRSLFGYEMGELLRDKISLAPTLLYLFHKINLALDGTPTIIVLDEAWALIDNPVFAKRIKDWLKTLRKLNAMVVFATQSVEDATNSAISDTLVQQTATHIFLPNPKATDTYKKVFMISDREFNLLKTTDPGSRYFLLKQGKDVVVARIDLSGMEELVYVLSGRIETVLLLDEIRAQVGDDPNVWLPIFYQRVREREDL